MTLHDTPRFECEVAIGDPTDRVTLMVGTTGAVFVEGPRGLTAVLREADAEVLAQSILKALARVRDARAKEG